MSEERLYRIGSALSSLGLSQTPIAEGGDNECYSIEHYDETLVDEDGEEVWVSDQHYTVNGHVYPATGAYYRFAVNRKGGALFAQNLLGPVRAAEKELGGDIHVDQLPQLGRASDVMWGYWNRNNANPRNIFNYFVNRITNDVTVSIISRVLRDHGMTAIPYWPGLELKMDNAEAKAILGKCYTAIALIPTDTY
jgi:hypothetical protein